MVTIADLQGGGSAGGMVDADWYKRFKSGETSERPPTMYPPQQPQRQEYEIPEMPAMPNYMGAWGDYMAWQRKQMEGIMKQYREQFPKFLRGWKEDKYADLSEATEDFYTNARTGVEKRGLGESPGFVAGAKIDTTEFGEKGAREIEQQAATMDLNAKSQMMGTLGAPNFGGIAQGYMNFENLMNQQSQMLWQQNFMKDMLKDSLDPVARSMPTLTLPTSRG